MSAPPHAEGHRDRLRVRFLRAGPGAFADHELIELLLTYAIPRRDVKPLAKKLLAECGSIAGVLAAPDEVLLGIQGIGPSALVLIRLAAALRPEAARPERLGTRDVLASSNDAAQYLHDSLLGKRDEEIHVLLVDPKNGVLGHEVLAQGTADEALLYPRKVVERALATRASGVLLGHNHPSGDPTPSDADRSLTANVAHALAAVGLRFLDHIVVGSTGHYSFRSMRPDLFVERG